MLIESCKQKYQTVNVTDNQIPVISNQRRPDLDSEGWDFVRQGFTATASAIDNCSVGNPTGLEKRWT